MTNDKDPMPERIPEGTVIDYELRDEFGKACASGLDRDQARELKSFAGGYVCKVVVVH